MFNEENTHAAYRESFPSIGHHHSAFTLGAADHVPCTIAIQIGADGVFDARHIADGDGRPLVLHLSLAGIQAE